MSLLTSVITFMFCTALYLHSETHAVGLGLAPTLAKKKDGPGLTKDMSAS